MRKPVVVFFAKTKLQISCAVSAQISCAVSAQIRCAVTAQLISAFAFATEIVTETVHVPNFLNP